MSMELLQPQVLEGDAAKHQFHTRESDVWAYGMVVNVSLTRLSKVSRKIKPTTICNAGNIEPRGALPRYYPRRASNYGYRIRSKAS
jgi:hypothetical protein